MDKIFSLVSFTRLAMDFQEKIRRTQEVLPKNYQYNLEVVPTQSEHLVNYRNKTVQDILQPISPESRRVLSLKHIEIIEFLQGIKPPIPIISIAIKNNYKDEYQLKITIPYQISANQFYLNHIMDLIRHNTNINIVSGYYQIKLPNKPKPTKFDPYYHYPHYDKHVFLVVESLNYLAMMVLYRLLY